MNGEVYVSFSLCLRNRLILYSFMQFKRFRFQIKFNKILITLSIDMQSYINSHKAQN